VARAEGELRDANKALDQVVKEADTVNQQRNTMHTEKRTRDKKLRDAQVSVCIVCVLCVYCVCVGGGVASCIMYVHCDVGPCCRML